MLLVMNDDINGDGDHKEDEEEYVNAWQRNAYILSMFASVIPSFEFPTSTLFLRRKLQVGFALQPSTLERPAVPLIAVALAPSHPIEASLRPMACHKSIIGSVDCRALCSRCLFNRLEVEQDKVGGLELDDDHLVLEHAPCRLSVR